MALADYFERVAAGAGNPKAASNWVMGALTGKLNETRATIDESPLPPDALAELIVLIENGSDHRADREGRLREDVRVGPPRRRDRRRRGAGED